MLGHKTKHKLIYLCIRLDMMTADKVRWTPYRSNEITDCPCSTTILVHRRLRALVSPPHSSKDSKSEKALPQRVLVDMISRKVDHDDIDDATKIGRIFDMIKKYNQPQR
ncbi:hypothetical protein M9H77_21146 [Catharanthus roseus]|uniref:Uncharacterized protein n=1 Tax=Catharanthus roseus TaxID=4058 RepID=A0ACC0AQV4_CATRO|nr:hypothetical protein M9H77_21146 [Catharanthus roseus]